MDEFLTLVVSYVVPLIQAVGLVIVVLGLIEGLGGMFLNARRSLSGAGTARSFHEIRRTIGEKMVLGLEFFIASDIIQTVVVPTWESLGILAGIVAIRTVIVFFLDREIQASVKAQNDMNSASGTNRPA